MNRIKNVALGFSAVFALAFASCSEESGSSSAIHFPDGFQATQEIEGLNDMLQIPVRSSGQWQATVLDSCRWIYLVSESGSGDGQVTFAVGTNLSDEERTGKIRISNGDGYVDYTLKQHPYTGNGGNSAEDVQYENSGLGKGMYMENYGGNSLYDMMAGQIFQFRAMDDAPFDSIQFISTVNLPHTEIRLDDFAKADTSLTDIKADLTVNVKYGLFSLGLTGDFHMFGESRDTTKTWAGNVQRPLERSTLNYANISMNYSWKPNMDDAYKAARASLYDPTFLYLLDEIEKKINQKGATVDRNGQCSDSDLEYLLSDLDYYYGPAFVSSVTRGGSVSIDFQANESYSNDTLSVGGSLTVGFNSLFSIDGKASAEYLRAAKSLLNGSTLHLVIEGGTMATQNKMITALSDIVKPGADQNVDAILEAITAWSDEIKSENATISDVSVQGIWSLFSRNSRNYVRSYMVSKYPNNPDGSCPYMYNVQKIR